MSAFVFHGTFSQTLRSPPPPSTSIHGGSPAPFLIPHPSSTAGAFQLRRSVASGWPRQCNALYKPGTAEYVDLIEHGFPMTEYWHQIVENDTEKEAPKEFKSSEKLRQQVELIRSMLRSMEDGDITVSPYDTAWVAMVEDISDAGAAAPQFPSCLDWISNNQLPDGSWGDRCRFSIYDRIINTLACAVALTTWKIHPEKAKKGISFIQENIHKLQHENEEHMPIGFEVALPSLLEIAKKLDIDIPYDAPGLQEIYQRKELKLTKIPMDIMHKVATTLLHSLEGMPDLIWEKLLKLQSADGSFLFSPSSTAYALKQTKDHNCLKYLANIVHKFNGGVPNVYPVDLFEHIWAVDRLQRLGISRYFQSEIEECIDYVHRYWTNEGICWARNSEVQDIDDTAMAFRLMRLQGYDISADVFKNFENGGEFFCFVGQSTQAVTGMYNLYRASQLRFPGEDILEDASKFSSKFLQEKRANNELLDKWIITKDLPGEVGYALDMPWYASLPRVETRFFLEQYGGGDDVWIGKTLYRMPCVNNNTYLELAKLDYNNCQALHQEELRSLQKWCKGCSLTEYGLTEESLLQAYYIAVASMFEPGQSQARLAWAKTAILVEIIASHFDQHQEQKCALVDEFQNCINLNYNTNGARYKTRTPFVGTLVRTLNQLSLDMLLAHGRDVHHHLIHAWHKWLNTWKEGTKDNSRQGEAELYLHILNLSGLGSRHASEELLLSHSKYQQLLKATVAVCDQLRLFQSRKVQDTNGAITAPGGITTAEIESGMRELVKLVITKSPMDLDPGIKQNFLTVARSFYYTAYCSPGTISFHIAKVLFERAF